MELDDGTKALFGGAKALDEGMTALRDGLRTFDEAAVGKLIDFIGDDYQTVSDRVSAMLDLMNDYPSYAGKSDSMTGVTAFVIRTEPIETKEEA